MTRNKIILYLFLFCFMPGLYGQSPQKAEFGSIWVVVRHEADIYIDDQKVGKGIYFGKLAPGDHIVKADHWQYYPQSKNVTIAPGYMEKVPFRLNPRLGKLEVSVAPPGLVLILDGEKKERSTILIQYLIIGEHLLTCENKTTEFQLGIKIFENETLKIEFDSLGYPYPVAEQPEENTLGLNILNKGKKEITEAGICWSKEPGVILSNALGHQILDIVKTNYNLKTILPHGLYYARPYLSAAGYTIYGGELGIMVFSCSYPFIDRRDNEVYKTVQIGSQCWMAENLKTIRSNDGTLIKEVEKTGKWRKLEHDNKAYCLYYNKTANKDIYGILYTWAAAVDGADSNSMKSGIVQGLCPDGWHVPGDREWKELEIFLGMNPTNADDEGWRGTSEGGKLKESGNSHWNLPNTSASNSSGFTALPGGCRSIKGNFLNLGSYAYFWSTTDYNRECALSRTLINDGTEIYRSIGYKKGAFSVRCLKD